MDFIRQAGHITLWGTPCVYVEENDQIVLIPTEQDAYLVQPHELLFRDFELDYGNKVNLYNTAVIYKTNGGFNRDKTLFARYILKNYQEKKFDSMSLTGSVLDDFFRPSRYFKKKAAAGDPLTKDLIYSCEIADHWDIQFEGSPIQIELSYGNILHNGIASDLKLHSTITITFPQTDNVQYIYRLYSNFIKFLKLVRYNPSCSSIRTKLYLHRSEKRWPNGFLVDYSTPDEPCGTTFEINYDTYKPYMERFLSFAFSNENVLYEYYPNHGLRPIKDGYSAADYKNLFAAFECECHANSELYEIADSTRIANIKRDLLSLVKNYPLDDLAPEEQQFVNTVSDDISRLGTQFGQTRKIENAYMPLSDALNRSLQYILCDKKFGEQHSMDSTSLKKISNKLVKLRSKIVHGSSDNKISNEDYYIVHFFEVLTYAMLLKRIGLTDEEIEIIIGLVFHCNSIYQDTLLHSETLSNDQHTD